MKHSIQKKLAYTFIALMFSALAAIGLINAFYLQRFYSSKKQGVLTKSWEMMNDSGNKSNGAIEQYCSVNALTYAVADSHLNFLYTNSKDGRRMSSRLFGNLLDLELENTKILKSTDEYKVIQIYDRMVDMDYLELYGTLDNGNYYIVSTPLKSLSDSAKISTIFYFEIGIFVTILCVIVILVISKRLVRPIKELTVLSQRMADLDFDVHYESGGKDEIGILGEHFNQMSSKLEEAVSQLKSANARLEKDIEQKVQIDEMRKEFLSNVSHELKTPIALIQGYSEGLKDNINEDEESRAFYCDVIIDESAKLNQMVQKLLTLNQLEFGTEQVTMERFDLVELVRGILQNNHLALEQKQAILELDLPEKVYVWGDEFQIEEVFTNYLTNALNHLDGERKIEVQIKEENGRVTTRVYNTGAPIPEESLDQVWVKFYKVDKARTREYGGSGIGLSIVKAIMDSHGGNCSVQNEAEGVAFYFSLESKSDL